MSGLRRALLALGTVAAVIWLSWARRLWCPEYRSLKRQARNTVDAALRDNTVRRAAAPHGLEAVILWGAKFPLRFAFVVGGFSALVSIAFLPAPRPSWVIFTGPVLPADYSHSTYFGTIWSVQATLVALIYPIVLTFITVMLQRRAASKLALAVYLADSAVLPAGASSLLLVTAMSLQYFAAYYIPTNVFLFAAVFNGSWLLANIALTGHFLARTVRYVEDEVGQQAYLRLALSHVLREELTTSLSKQLLASAPQRLAWVKERGDKRDPEVTFFSLSRGETGVTRVLRREAVLVDVHLGALEWVARRWLARAARTSSHGGSLNTAPSMQFIPTLHQRAVGEIELCSIRSGPPLTSFEARIVSRSFVFAKPVRKLVATSTTDMLEELATEVQSLSDQGRHIAAREAFRKLLQLHSGLLEACEENAEVNGDVSSAAGLLVSPYSWGARNLNTSWLEPYRPLTEVAVSNIGRDQTLLSALAYAPTNIAAASELQPPQLVAELFMLTKRLDHVLAKWWHRQIQVVGVTPASNGVALPPPAAQDYRSAIISVVSGFTNFMYATRDSEAGAARAWKARCRAAQAWASHIETSAGLVLAAAARGDIAASQWYCDNLAMWWGNRRFELDYGMHVDFEPGLCDVRLGVTQLDWEQAHVALSSVAGRAVERSEALQVIWHSVYRYWESMRLLVCLILLEQAQSTHFSELAVTLVAKLMRCHLFDPGPTPEGRDLSAPDEALALYVETCCFDSATRDRLDAFCEREARRNENQPVIAGWGYSGSGRNTDLRSKVVVLNQLLLATELRPREPWTKSVEVARRSDATLRTLQEMAWLAGAALQSVRAKSFRQYLGQSDTLRQVLGIAPRTMHQRRYLAHGLARVRNESSRLRQAGLAALTVRPEAVEALARRLSAAILDTRSLDQAHTFCEALLGSPESATTLRATGWKFTKENLVEPPLESVPDARVFELGKDLLKGTVQAALNFYIVESKAAPIPHPDDPTLLLGIDTAARHLFASGQVPVAIVPPGAAATALRPYSWGRAGRPSLPSGITVTYQQPAKSKFAAGFVNETPIVHMRTPGDHVYVVPLKQISHLLLQPATGDDIFVATFAVTGVNEVKVDLEWRVGFE